MKNTIKGVALVHTVIAIVVLGLIVFGITSLNDHSPTAATNTGIYCSPDGTLSNTQSIQSHRSYCIKSSGPALAARPNTPVSYLFSIVDDEGNAVKDFKIAHEKILHLIVVRKDLNEFQHLHPEFDANTGVFTLSNLTFPTPGDYRIFADFVPGSAMMGPDSMPLTVTLSEDVKVAGSYTPQAIGTPIKIVNVEGYTIALATDPQASVTGMNTLSFKVTKDGKPVTNLQPYLGALGHAVVLKEGTLDYIHAHALQKATAIQNGTINFHVEFPYSGNYKVFMQFQHGGKVTTSFVVLVKGDVAPVAMPGMEH